MTSVGALAVTNAAWALTVARSHASITALLLLLLAGLGAVVDGHRPHHGRPRTSSVGDQRGIHDSRVVQDAEYVVPCAHFVLRGVPRGYSGTYTPRFPCIVPQRDRTASETGSLLGNYII